MRLWKRYLKGKWVGLKVKIRRFQVQMFTQAVLGWVLGIAWCVLMPAHWGILAVISCVGCWTLQLRIIAVALLCTCGWYVGIFLPARATEDANISGEVSTVAVVLDRWERGNSTLLILEMDGVSGLQLGKISQPELQTGDVVSGRFKVQQLPPKLQYLRAENFRFYITEDGPLVERENELRGTAYLARLKRNIVNIIHAHMPEPEGSLLIGLLLGGRAADLPAWLDEDLRLSGLSHIASISGYNVSVIVGGLVVFAGLLPRRRLCWLLLPLLWCFLLFIGMHNLPAQRAVVMGMIMLILVIVGRHVSRWIVLLYTLGYMLVINPLAMGSVSLWLSISAYIGITCFTGFWQSILPNFSTLVHQNLASTLGVYTASVPIFAGIFGSVSLSGIVSNVFVLPLIPIAMGVGALAVIISLITEHLGVYLFWCVRLLLNVVVSVSDWGAGLTFLLVSDSWVVWGGWLAVLGAMIWIDFRHTVYA